eukprot:GHVT01010865.1.p1 GENE.GHVT01010865.1~~GHVT01010865.1.p1  ORF type:complete len:117 (-),score=1.59 GHVT01010865.1:314-664(-)
MNYGRVSVCLPALASLVAFVVNETASYGSYSAPGVQAVWCSPCLEIDEVVEINVEIIAFVVLVPTSISASKRVINIWTSSPLFPRARFKQWIDCNEADGAVSFCLVYIHYVLFLFL